MVTKDHHCLGDLLIRNHFKTLGATIQCVIGNYNNLEDVCKRFEIPFHFITHADKTKEAFEAGIHSVIQQYPVDYLVLARFMRILSPEFVKNMNAISSISIIHFYGHLQAQTLTGKLMKEA